MTYRPPRKAPSDRSHLERLVQALSVEEGIAAERFEVGENDRFRDLIDLLLLLRDLKPDLRRVAAACREIFALRAKQAWPPSLTIEASWPEQYRALAIDQDFAVVEVADAVSEVRSLIEDIDREGRHGI